jgi:hypothetical protein
MRDPGMPLRASRMPRSTANCSAAGSAYAAREGGSMELASRLATEFTDRPFVGWWCCGASSVTCGYPANSPVACVPVTLVRRPVTPCSGRSMGRVSRDPSWPAWRRWRCAQGVVAGPHPIRPPRRMVRFRRCCYRVALSGCIHFIWKGPIYPLVDRCDPCAGRPFSG